MTDSTWTGQFATTGNTGVYDDSLNWTAGLPGPSDTATFGTNRVTNIFVESNVDVGEWHFLPGASEYKFIIAPVLHGAVIFINFELAGITIDGGSVDIYNYMGISFNNNSTTGQANIENYGEIDFFGTSSAGSSTITTHPGGVTFFFSHSTGGNAQLITDAGGSVSFAASSGPLGDHRLTVGSINGGGTYGLGADQLTVLSGNVSGLIFGIGGLVKVGPGTLKLSGAGNTYAGGTILEAGALDVAAPGAAGPGAITFATVGKTKATLNIDNSALSAHHFGNPIDNFAKHDFLDLTGLHFHAGATATYHKANHHLTVHSGGVTDVLTLLSPHGTHFATASDHHGGTDVFLVFA
jgi:autotransporter-associated beta strand protein